ncbi:LysR family transcriptional regulator [Pseudomonas sp. RIT-PI-q]|uniref:LysR substrate-binding domain-containing protein n=1 Tax=Pseudomonas sp. RIT-PI-q TaxID=1690247 RepID=UPI0006CDA938|nr:LysR substrate-binding domain-containing protein [Pseudomonas sp. RIT-PI-q]KPH01582.1 LysR family transcriptional regulator [Pseudomonas sp. RIT-PI-q]
MNLPPLKALRVFECVARLGHVGAAAAELHVTAGAVSQQLRALTEALGTKLLIKQGRSLVLTERGLALQQAVARGMLEFTEGVRLASGDTQSLPAPAVLTISTEPIFGASWLMPKLFAFRAEHPQIRLRILAADGLQNVDWKRADVAILYGAPPWEGFWWRPLLNLHMFPVCCPQMLQGRNGLRHPSDLMHHRLLHEDDGSQWRRWLVEARTPYPGDADVHLEDFGMALQAARDGFGVALSDEINSSRDLRDGTLVQPFSFKVPAVMDYFCICNEERSSVPEVTLFIDWIVNQARNV